MATLAVALLAPAPAQANDHLDQLYNFYSHFGRLPPCVFPTADLRSALSSIPADISAYDPGFAEAVERALTEGLKCGEHRGNPVLPVTGSGTVLAADGSPGPAPPPRRLLVAGLGGSGPGIPGALAGLAAVALLISLITVSLAMRWNRSPR